MGFTADKILPSAQITHTQANTSKCMCLPVLGTQNGAMVNVNDDVDDDDKECIDDDNNGFAQEREKKFRCWNVANTCPKIEKTNIGLGQSVRCLDIAQNMNKNSRQKH